MNTLIKVSIVEDDHAVREIFADWVGHADGFRCVSTYANGERAVADLPRVRSNIVLMDINLPQMNGVECVRRLKPLLPATQFVMVTFRDADHFRCLGGWCRRICSTDATEAIAGGTRG